MGREPQIRAGLGGETRDRAAEPGPTARDEGAATGQQVRGEDPRGSVVGVRHGSVRPGRGGSRTGACGGYRRAANVQHPEAGASRGVTARYPPAMRRAATARRPATGAARGAAIAREPGRR